MTPSSASNSVDRPHLKQKLCWFCGKLIDSFCEIDGHSIGGMVFSSQADVSLDPSESALTHIREDGAVICTDCVANLQSFPHRDLRSEAELDELSRLRFEEMFDFETGLITLEERRFPFECWFSYFPLDEHNGAIQSLTLSELYDRGYRMHGQVVLPPSAVEQFLSRCKARLTPYGNGFQDHILETLGASLSDHVGRIAGVRASISGLAIRRLSKSTDCGPRIAMNAIHDA